MTSFKRLLAGQIAILTAANVLNNRVAPRLGPLTSAAATGLLVAMARRSGASWEDLGFHHGRRGAVVGGALAAGVVAVYSVGVALPATRRFFRDERALGLSRARALEEALLQVPVGTVLLEEVGFRGVVYGTLTRSHGPAAATAVSSALFGLWHVLPAMDMAEANPALGRLASGEGIEETIEEIVEELRHPDEAPPPRPWKKHLDTARVVAGSVLVTGAAGVLFCELRRRGGLLAPSMLHTATNSLGYAFARLAADLPDGISHPQG
ncbi:type II CAAX endopeptidase family protein [Spongiactinospora sp. TRM90649]|uniref:CPBP family intramembrane glutamic endopeptidase n=1 Tax=Spongiactinospora sp. TRM90649 TaxID=3031114 RepID=UPI0023F818BC|nr:type II CAAX endopeptidase family protein [Spongiactinospora sp. TRM90649]MDF5751339.1 type II CAAX endopeptidase family protein [Spongiactinospora sp. TRM90649]